MAAAKKKTKKKATQKRPRRKDKSVPDDQTPRLEFDHGGREYQLPVINAWIALESAMSRHKVVNEHNEPTRQFLHDVAARLEELGMSDSTSTIAYWIWRTLGDAMDERKVEGEDHEIVVNGTTLPLLDTRLAMQDVEREYDLPSNKYVPTLEFCAGLVAMLKKEGVAGCRLWDAYLAWRDASLKMQTGKKNIRFVQT